MPDTLNAIQAEVLRDMSEGVLTLGLDGRITSVNPAAERILDRTEAELTGNLFARCFFEYSENDAFNQAILDAVYDPGASHENIVPYFTGKVTRQLHVTTSYLRQGGERIGLIAVLGSVSELTELRDAVKAMERIKALNKQLELRNRLLNETFGRFLSDEIVRQLLDTPDGLALGGRKKIITMMMSDLRGFTALSERMEAPALVAMLNHYLAEMTDVIQDHGGTIIEFIGDGIMSVFGALTPTSTHAADAVAAAVEMQARMHAVNAWNAERGYPPLEMGIGVHSGSVIVGNIGSERRTKYGAIGKDVNLCGRIESYTVGGQVLISPMTRELISAELTVEQEMEVRPKGVRGALTLASVTGIGAPYDLSFCVSREKLTALAKPADTAFYRITEKHCEGSPHTGRLTALGEDGAVLQTEEALRRYDNLKLDAMGELFCKVLDRREDGYVIRFTSKPPRFSEWLSAGLAAGS